ncbi:MAG: hypothetical protein ACRD63_06145 [Pyrinomonadaceae bacterium]
MNNNTQEDHTITMHAARTALNHNPEMRAWATEWLKIKERTEHSEFSDEEFERHWMFVQPERVHDGAVEAVTAFRQQNR